MVKCPFLHTPGSFDPYKHQMISENFLNQSRISSLGVNCPAEMLNLMVVNTEKRGRTEYNFSKSSFSCFHPSTAYQIYSHMNLSRKKLSSIEWLGKSTIQTNFVTKNVSPSSKKYKSVLEAVRKQLTIYIQFFLSWPTNYHQQTTTCNTEQYYPMWTIYHS